MGIKDVFKSAPAETSSLEADARESTVCLGCGEDKSVGLVVCWGCFKYRRDTLPLKPFVEQGHGTLADWLLSLPE